MPILNWIFFFFSFCLVSIFIFNWMSMHFLFFFITNINNSKVFLLFVSKVVAKLQLEKTLCTLIYMFSDFLSPCVVWSVTSTYYV